MRKFFIAASFLLMTLFAKQTNAQSLYCGVSIGTPSELEINSVSLNILTQQKSVNGPNEDGSTPNDLSGSLNWPGGTSTILGILYYWDVPTIVNELNFSMTSANYVVLTNTSSQKLITWIVVLASTSDAPIGTGPEVTINPGASATVYFPNAGQRFITQASMGPVDPYDYGYPITFPLQIAIQAAPTN